MDKLKTTILIFNDLTALDAVGPYEVLSKIPNSKVVFASLEPGLITCQQGLQLAAECSFRDIKETDILLIPGGKGIEKLLNNNEILEWVRMLHKSTKFTVSVCTGALLLGAAGILKGLKATTYWNRVDRLKEYEAEYIKSRYIIDGKVITSAGVSAGIDMSLKLVSLIQNESLAKIIQLAIEYDPEPPYDAGSPDKISMELLDIFHKANPAQSRSNKT